MILTVGAAAAGGACVARADDGRVVFVRHALPGERVRVVVTSSTTSFLRADAVEVLSASPDRVEPPCPFAGPGRCGGCDWQHAALPAQRDMKAGLVAEQLARLAGVTWNGSVQEVLPTLGWRTRVSWAVTAAGDVGLHRHRSHELELVDECLIAAPGATAPLGLSWPGAKSIEAFAVDGQTVLSVVGKQVTLPSGPGADAEGFGLVVDGRPVRQPHGVRTSVLGRPFEVAAGGFWQVHPAAATVLSAAVLELLAPAVGESVADLYAGVGLFASLLGQAVGSTGSVLAVEADSRACADAARNTADQPWVSVRTASVEVGLVRGLASRRPALIVLDPPRAGAGLDVSAALAQLRPRALAYVSCDAASFARDLRVFTDTGWSLGELRAYDLFPMTEHVELVGLLLPP
ncbi:MAG: class I SAM-dependent RNA methyltransferase [Pseudorhodobacter sp.]|nr:class I SAM-dependent RNA methyltransferase [Frankiaceae bacterium]